MISARAALIGSYDYLQVALSALIAVSASYAALDLGGRVTAARGGVRLVWLSGGAVAMGIGMWAMHFVAMCAFSLPIPISYNLPTVLVSLLVGILCSAFALYVVSRHKMGWSRALAGSILMGAGIAGLHYIGMDAMRLAAVCRFDLRIVALSVLLAILFSQAALILAFDLREETRGTPLRKTMSALVMGAAVTAMHYTGMASARFTASAVAPDLSHAVRISWLVTTGIGVVTLIVLGIAILTSATDRRLAVLAEALEHRVAERTRQLDAANQALRKELAERERIEQSLRLFRMLIDQSNDAIEVIDPDTFRFIDVNGKACLDLGYSREEFLSLSVFDIDPSADESMVARVKGELRDSGSAIFESFHKRKDGSTFPVEVSLTEVKLDRIYWVSVVRDITERKLAEEALHKSEERFRLAAQAGRMFAYEWDVATDVIVRSAEAAQILGIDSTAPLHGQQAMAAIHPDDRERVRASIMGLTPEKPDLGISYRIIHPDGTVIWVERNSRAQFDEQGRLLRVVGMIADITDRKRVEEELRQAQTRTESVLESVSDTHILFDRDWHYLYVNRAAMLAMGRPREQILGRTLWELYPDIVGTELERQYRYAMEKRIPVTLDFHYPAASTWWENRFYPAPAGLSVFATDITERKRAEQSLQEAQAELARVTRALTMGELVASLAHEVYQPLTAVVATSNLIKRQLATKTPNLQEMQLAITEIVEDANRVSTVISRIRALFTMDVPDRVELDINEVIQEVTVLVRGEAARNGVQFRLELAAGLPHVLGDRVQLQQVLINLVMNGIDAMRTVNDRPRNLDIESAKHADGVLVRVQDSGTGVDPNHAERIFAPFFTTKRQGTGMGLSISRSIIESHGGRLWTEPSSYGAIFQFVLPSIDIDIDKEE